MLRQAGERGEHTEDGYRLQWNRKDQRPGELVYCKAMVWFQETNRLADGLAKASCERWS